MDNVHRARYALPVGFENGRLVRVVLRATKGSDQQVTTFHYNLDDNNDVQPNDPQSLADTFRDDVRPGWANFFRSSWSVQPVEVVEEIDPLNPTAARTAWSSGAAIAGTKTDSEQDLPSFTCGLVTLRTGHLGRRFRGRIFIPGQWTEGSQNAGVWETGTYNGITTWVNTIPFQPDIAGPGSGAVAHWCVYSRTQRAADLDPYASSVTSATLRNELHSLRSRASYS